MGRPGRDRKAALDQRRAPDEDGEAVWTGDEAEEIAAGNRRRIPSAHLMLKKFPAFCGSRQDLGFRKTDAAGVTRGR
jgi:hypothetical protein